jgi:hypothetical protein
LKHTPVIHDDSANAGRLLGADPVMGADQPGFDVAEQSVDDQEAIVATCPMVWIAF